MSQKNVLIVDDSKISRLMLTAIIANEKPGWTILEAEDGAQALEISAEHEIDVVTLDMNMPGEDGLTIAPRLQKNAPKAIIALLTANFAERIQDQARSQGLLFIAKPITEGKVVEFINHCTTKFS